MSKEKKKAELEKRLAEVKIKYNKACEEMNYRIEVESILYKEMDWIYTELAKFED